MKEISGPRAFWPWLCCKSTNAFRQRYFRHTEEKPNQSQETATKSLLDHNVNQLAIAHRVAGNGAISHSLPVLLPHSIFFGQKSGENAIYLPSIGKKVSTLYAVGDLRYFCWIKGAPALFQRAEKGAHKDTRPGFSTLFA